MVPFEMYVDEFVGVFNLCLNNLLLINVVFVSASYNEIILVMQNTEFYFDDVSKIKFYIF